MVSDDIDKLIFLSHYLSVCLYIPLSLSSVCLLFSFFLSQLKQYSPSLSFYLLVYHFATFVQFRSGINRTKPDFSFLSIAREKNVRKKPQKTPPKNVDWNWFHYSPITQAIWTLGGCLNPHYSDKILLTNLMFRSYKRKC